jgi:DNA-binding transcriptional LysR family regulator
LKVDFDGIQAFVTVADLGGFGRAARELHLTQTALTRRVQKLEAFLGLKLLNRTTRRVELSAVGREFLPQARAMIQEMTAAVERLRDLSQQATGRLVLACIPSMTTHVLPSLIRRYASAYPEIRISLLDGSSLEVRHAVLDGRADLGIALHADAHPDLQQQALFADPLVFICRSPHPLEHAPSARWEQMAQTELIGVSNFTATRIVMDYQLARRGIRLKSLYDVQHHATAINLVAAGVGAAILPASTFEEGDRPGVRKIALTHPVVRRRVVTLQRRGEDLTAAAAAFKALMVQALKSRRD